MGEIFNKIKDLHAALPQGVTLVAVSKFHPVEKLLEAYDAGQRHFGESRVQELEQKVPQMPEDVTWHFIGHLQSNKVKKLVRCAQVIQSVDSLKILHEIDKEAAKQGREISVMLQVHVAQEETKFGFASDEIVSLSKEGAFEGLQAVRIVGVMAMATNTEDEAVVKQDFERARDVFEELEKGEFAGRSEFSELSMGMSDDYAWAIERGSTVVRIGSSIFGPREY